MNKILKKLLVEVIRALCAAGLSIFAVANTGCVASGDHSSASFIQEVK